MARSVGIPAAVSGRQRNVVVDFEKIRTEGLSTIRREYDALSHFMELPKSAYKRKEPGSKVTYQWVPQPDGKPAVQVRIDSYRITLNKLFSLFEAKLSTATGEISDGKLKTELKKHILAVKLQINDSSSELNKKQLKEAMSNLKEFITSELPISGGQLQDIGFDELNDRIMHHAEGGGLTNQGTGVTMDDPLFENEREPFVQVIKEHPLLKELSNAVKTFQIEFTNRAQPDSKVLNFVKALGTDENISDDSLYASIFSSYRKHMINENDGLSKMPEYLELLASATINMVNQFNHNPTMTQSQKEAVVKQYSNEIEKQFSTGFFKTINNYVSGFFQGVGSALAERHGATIFETIGQVIKAGSEYAEVKHSNFLSYAASHGEPKARASSPW